MKGGKKSAMQFFSQSLLFCNFNSTYIVGENV